MTSSAPSPAARLPRRFVTTRWSLILQARRHGDAPARAALEELCEAYWLPVYAFMRRQSKDVHEAQDLTQGFFASLLSHDALDEVHPARGRFRSFLLAAAKHFVCNDWDRNSAAMRGGRVVLQSLDYDLGVKASLYAAAGIADYWVVDVVARRVLVHRTPAPDAMKKYGHGYSSITVLVPSQSIAPLALPQTPVDAAELLQ